MGRDSSVGIAIRYRLDAPGIESRRVEIFCSRPDGAHPASYTMCTGSFAGVEQPRPGVEHLLWFRAEVKESVELLFFWFFMVCSGEKFTFLKSVGLPWAKKARVFFEYIVWDFSGLTDLITLWYLSSWHHAVLWPMPYAMKVSEQHHAAITTKRTPSDGKPSVWSRVSVIGRATSGRTAFRIPAHVRDVVWGPHVFVSVRARVMYEE